MTRRELLQLSAATAISSGLTSPGSPLVAADDIPKNTDDMIHAYLAAKVKEITPRFMDGAKSKAEWEAARPRLKSEYLYMLGLDPLPEKTPLKATVTGTIERSSITIEKLHYQSRPGLYVTGNLYLPKSDDKKQKHPAILYVCGHADRGRDGNKSWAQDHGLWFASHGYVCLIVDTLQLGEVAGKHHGTYELGRWWWHDRGYTPAGVECWNGIRGIDYLVSRPEVDPEKIGVTGISGGGAATVWISCADERVKVAVPVSGYSDLESYVTDKVIDHHCDCMFPVNAYQWDLTTVLALFAPKPMLFANSDNDMYFPMPGNRRVSAQLRKCYDMLGAKQNFDDYVSVGKHDYRPDLRLAVFGFFQKHLKHDDAAIKDADFPKIEGKDLRVFPTDADLPKDSINAKADESFVPMATVKLPADVKEFKEWKAGLVKQLREKCFRALPEKVPAAKEEREGLVEFQIPEEGIRFETTTYGVGPMRINFFLMMAVFNPDEKLAYSSKALTKYKMAANLITEVSTRGGGSRKWTSKNPPNTVERSLPLIGQTADSGRVRDVASVLVAKAQDKKPSVRVAGTGQAGIIAAYAAMFVPEQVLEVVIADSPLSHRDGPHFLNVLRVLDIPEALGLLAPDVKLTLIGKNAKDKAFDRTEAIYKAAGAADKFKRE